MILALKRQFDHAPSEYRVHLGVSLEQYGEFLFVCGRQEEARIAERQAATHGDALCNAGTSTFIAPTPTYYRYRQRSLFNFGDHVAACVNGVKLVDHCRSLYRSEGAQHAELLALALLLHRDSLMRVGRTSEANACLDEAVKLVQSEELSDRNGVAPRSRTMVSPPSVQKAGIHQHSPTLAKPLRFKHPITRHLDFYWETDWQLSHDRAITAEAGAVVCARELFRTSPTEHGIGKILAQALQHYGDALFHAQQYEAACDPLSEAVNIVRELCLHHQIKYRPMLSLCLGEYGTSLYSQGIYDAACTVHAEAVNVARGLARLNQDLYEPELAARLREYGVTLHALKEYDAACDAHAHAVEITRELYRLDPDKFKVKLADRLQEYSASLHACQMYRAACDANAEAITITRDLCRLHPGEYKAELADRLQDYALSLSPKMMYRSARRVMAEAVNITRELCRRHPSEYKAELASRLREYCISLYDISPMRYQDRRYGYYKGRKWIMYKPYPFPARACKRRLRTLKP